ncbi:YqaJ domain-containing protein, partial [Aphis craccivora]
LMANGQRDHKKQNIIHFSERRLLLGSTQKITVLFVSEQQTEKLRHLFTFVSLIGKNHQPPWRWIVGILEGFSNSLNMHGLKYNKLIGNGDSSFTNKLNEVMPYGPENHLRRNYGMKMSALSKKIEYPAIIRKFITTNILRFRSDITYN